MNLYFTQSIKINHINPKTKKLPRFWPEQLYIKGIGFGLNLELSFLLIEVKQRAEAFQQSLGFAAHAGCF